MFYPAGILVVILTVILLLGLAWIWLWLIFRINEQGWKSIAGAMALQLSIVTFVVGLFLGGGAFWNALFPPLFFPFFLGAWFGESAFLSQLRPSAGIAGALTFAGCLAIPKLRIWSVAPTLFAALLTGVVVGERVSKTAMCTTAATLGITEFQRNTLWWSLRNAPQEWQFEIHATGKLGDNWMGWSYREMNWYVIPQDAWGEVKAPVFDCKEWLSEAP